jgi:hypothetical protein
MMPFGLCERQRGGSEFRRKRRFCASKLVKEAIFAFGARLKGSRTFVQAT